MHPHRIVGSLVDFSVVGERLRDAVGGVEQKLVEARIDLRVVGRHGVARLEERHSGKSPFATSTQ